MRYEEISEATLPVTEYGYWITPLGAAYPVGDHGHEPFIRKEENMSSAQAMLRGWIRVVTVKAFQAEASFSHVSPRAKSTLLRLARQEEYSLYIVDAYTDGEYSINQFRTLHDLIRGIEQLCREDALTEGLGEYDDHPDMAKTIMAAIKALKGMTRKLPITVEVRPYRNRYTGDVQGLLLTDLFAREPGQGAGTKVMSAMIKLANAGEFNIHTDAEGPRSAAFYEKFGFEHDSHSGHQLVYYPPIQHDDD